MKNNLRGRKKKNSRHHLIFAVALASHEDTHLHPRLFLLLSLSAVAWYEVCVRRLCRREIYSKSKDKVESASSSYCEGG